MSVFLTSLTLSSFCGFTDVLTAALTDTLREQPQLLSVAREGLLEGSSAHQLLHQLLALNPASRSGDSVSAYLIHDNTFLFTVINVASHSQTCNVFRSYNVIVTYSPMLTHYNPVLTSTMHVTCVFVTTARHIPGDGPMRQTEDVEGSCKYVE
jgi:hypothetical protein